MFDETLLKVVFSWLPRPCIAAIAATAISAAIRPYSIAVAPRVSRQSVSSFTIIIRSPVIKKGGETYVRRPRLST